MDLFTALIVKISLFIALVSGSPITGVSEVSIATTTVPSSISAPVTVYPDVVMSFGEPLDEKPIDHTIDVIPVGKITEEATSTVKEIPILIQVQIVEEPKKEDPRALLKSTDGWCTYSTNVGKTRINRHEDTIINCPNTAPISTPKWECVRIPKEQTTSIQDILKCNYPLKDGETQPALPGIGSVSA